jgi:hypothetical protein
VGGGAPLDSGKGQFLVLNLHRPYPRAPVDTIVRVVRSSGDVEYGKTSDVSLDGFGLNIACFHRMNTSFHPSYAPCQICINLFNGESLRKIRAFCMINNLLSEDGSYRIGSRFTQLGAEDEACLAEFIDYPLQRFAVNPVRGRSSRSSVAYHWEQAPWVSENH